MCETLAEAIAGKLRRDPLVAKVDVAGPGFINLTLDPSAWRDALRTAIRIGPPYGGSHVGRGEAVNIEYVSANPTGPMHVGHCRGAVFGDALANLLDVSGHAVTREYYINDAGAQVDVLARSAYLRYRGGRFVHALTSLRSFVGAGATIGGSDGYITYDAPFLSAGSFRVETPPHGEPRTVTVDLEGNGYVPLFRAVGEAIADGLLEHPLRPLAETIAVLDTIDEIRRQLGGVRR